MLTAERGALVKNATARLHAAHDVTDAYRAARERAALAWVEANKQPFGPVAAAARRRLHAADLQLDAAIHTEQAANYALMRAKELGI